MRLFKGLMLTAAAFIGGLVLQCAGTPGILTGDGGLLDALFADSAQDAEAETPTEQSWFSMIYKVDGVIKELETQGSLVSLGPVFFGYHDGNEELSWSKPQIQLAAFVKANRTKVTFWFNPSSYSPNVGTDLDIGSFVEAEDYMDNSPTSVVGSKATLCNFSDGNTDGVERNVRLEEYSSKRIAGTFSFVRSKGAASCKPHTELGGDVEVELTGSFEIIPGLKVPTMLKEKTEG